MSKPKIRSAEYEAGYLAGYQAGRQKAEGVPRYRKQGWRCRLCDKSGVVLFRSDDDAPKRLMRLRVSHQAASKRDRHDGDFLMLTKRQTEAL